MVLRICRRIGRFKMPDMPLPSEQEFHVLIDELKEDATHHEKEAVYSLLGIYFSDSVPIDVKKDIKDFLIKDEIWGKDILDEMRGIVKKDKTKSELWEERWHRRGNMERKSDIDATNPIVLEEYLKNFRNIMKRQMPYASDEELYQEGFTQMIQLLLPDDKAYNSEYLSKLVDLAKTFQPPINIEIPTTIIMEIRRREADKEEKEEAERIVKERQQRKEHGELTLEEQMEDAIAEERYEDAADIKKKMDDLKRSMGNWHGSLTIREGECGNDTIVVHADNLDLVQPDKPYDIKQPDQLRKRHRMRYRNEPGGSDEILWEGIGTGYNDVDKGVGSDQHSDVGSPASINVAKQKKIIRTTNPNMPNEKMERDPQEEKATTDTWFEFNNMQDK